LSIPKSKQQFPPVDVAVDVVNPSDEKLLVATTPEITTTNLNVGAVDSDSSPGLVVVATPETPKKQQPDPKTPNTEKNCVPSSSSNSNNTTAYHFEATTGYRNSTILPQWMKDYFDWHREQTVALNECNYKDYKFLILRCSLKERKCGGVADRLKSIPFFIAASALSKRIFLIRWERPTKLEEFLVPNEINWSMPDWLPEKTDHFAEKSSNSYFMLNAKYFHSHLMRKKYTDMLVLEGMVQDYYGGSSFYYKMECELDENKTYNETLAEENGDSMGWMETERIFRHLFYTIFEPSPPVKKLIQEKMALENLVPGKFAAAQYRAFYGIENQKNRLRGADAERKTRNALKCASKAQSGVPIVFASDSRLAVLEAQKMDNEGDNRKIIVFDTEKEAVHLDKRYQWTSKNLADLYPAFVEVLIMAEAKCISIGLGGYGRFANMLSTDPTCAVRHEVKLKKQPPPCRWHGRYKPPQVASAR